MSESFEFVLLIHVSHGLPLVLTTHILYPSGPSLEAEMSDMCGMVCAVDTGAVS